MSVQKQERRIELDRDTWAGYEKVQYNLRVVGRGEAIAGPFYFGQAFDSPPFFTFSAVAENGDMGTAVQLTAGVSEWIQDAQKMYVGAYVWFAWDACWEPLKTGVVYYEDFEDILDRQGGGPDGNEILVWDRLTGEDGLGGYNWPSVVDGSLGPAINDPVARYELVDGDNTYTPIRGGIIEGGFKTFNRGVRTGSDTTPPTRSYFTVSSDSPASGKYHARQFFDARPGPTLVPNYLGGIRAGLVTPCPSVLQESGNSDITWEEFLGKPLFYNDGSEFDEFHGTFNLGERPVFPCRPGMQIEAQFDVKFDQIHDVVDQQTWMNVNFYDWDMALLGTTFDVGNNTFASTSWQTHYGDWNLVRDGGFNPATEPDWAPDELWQRLRYFSFSFFIRSNPISFNAPYPELTVDFDNLQIKLVGDFSAQLPPAFNVNLRFQGQMLKGYANIHELRSYEAPTKVVLS